MPRDDAAPPSNAIPLAPKISPCEGVGSRARGHGGRENEQRRAVPRVTPRLSNKRPQTSPGWAIREMGCGAFNRGGPLVIGGRAALPVARRLFSAPKTGRGVDISEDTRRQHEAWAPMSTGPNAEPSRTLPAMDPAMKKRVGWEAGTKPGTPPASPPPSPAFSPALRPVNHTGSPLLLGSPLSLKSPGRGRRPRMSANLASSCDALDEVRQTAVEKVRQTAAEKLRLTT